MAIEIKAIQCPKCGSTEKTELRLDHFRCDSCGTEYFLDDGNPRPGPKPVVDSSLQTRTTADGISPVRLFFFVSVFIVIVAIVLIGSIFSSSSSSHYSGTSASIPAKEPATWQYNYSYVYLSPDKRPILIAMGTFLKNDPPGHQPEPYVFFQDALTDSLIKRFQIPGRDHSSSSDSWHFQQLSNGDLYAETGHESLYKIDRSSYSMKDVTQTFGAGQPELESGIAKVEFIPNGNQDGFHVVTNDGKQLYYFPFMHKVYKEHDFWTAETGMNSVLPFAKPATGFFFTGKRTDDDSDRLIKLRYLDNGIGPKQVVYCGWQPNGEPAPLNPNFERVLSRMNFTPGRLYFQPKVLFSDSDYVLISFAPTAANTYPLIQCLNARTAAIVFTTRLDDNLDGAIRYKDGFAVYYSQVYLIDMKGKLTKLKNGN